MQNQAVVLFAFIGLFCGLDVVRGETSFWLFSGESFDNHVIYDLSNATDLLNDPNFDHSLPTVVYAHGWSETPEAESVHLVIGSYLKRGGYNTIFLDWSEKAGGLYPTAVSNVKPLGITLGRILVDWFDKGLNISTFHLVGHSLGSQLTGYMGRTVQSASNTRYIIPRITALDPAGPLWYVSGRNTPLSAIDAEFVDVIQTDTRGFGALHSTGTVDFYPNGGTAPQPGCDRFPITTCSHHVSWRLWSESLTAEDQTNTFVAIRASSWQEFTTGHVDRSHTIQMGINCPIGATGDWYLQTNAEIPHSQGVDGITFA